MARTMHKFNIVDYFILLFLAFVIVLARTKTYAININYLLLLMVILCLLILGLNVSDIKELYEALFLKWKSLP